MTVNEIYNLVSYIAQKDREGYISPAEFNLLLKQAQWEYFLKVYNPGKDLAKELDPFLVTTQLQISNGVAKKPVDYIFPSSIIYRVFKGSNDINDIEVNILDNKKFAIRNGSMLTGPTRSYPICTFYGDSIKFSPNGLGQVQFDYLRKPVDPYWDYDFVDDINGNGSQIVAFKPKGQEIVNNPYYINNELLGLPRASRTRELELPETAHNSIVMLILQHVGISLDNTALTQYSNAKANENN